MTNPQFPADLVTLTEEILNGKLHFLSSDKLFETDNTLHFSRLESDEIKKTKSFFSTYKAVSIIRANFLFSIQQLLCYDRDLCPERIKVSKKKYLVTFLNGEASTNIIFAFIVTNLFILLLKKFNLEICNTRLKLTKIWSIAQLLLTAGTLHLSKRGTKVRLKYRSICLYLTWYRKNNQKSNPKNKKLYTLCGDTGLTGRSFFFQEKLWS